LIPEIGHYALVLALCLALGQALVPMAGLLVRNPVWASIAQPAAVGQFVFVLLAYAALTQSFLVNDFSVAYVAHNSNTDLPVGYRVAAVWGAHEGSLLLWVLMLAAWTLAVAVFSRNLPSDVRACVLAVMGAISVGFLLFMLFTSNPFERLFPAPEQGRDLNPLLQDPGMIIHPPMLYMGYVGFSVAFAFAIAALVSGKVDTAWTRWTRPWTTTAWLFLTFGITLGSWWAYRELGWGGWWFWDPVENASFMPWLVGTALIHSLAVTEKRGVFKSWTVLLAITAFSLSLLGTFLVRSGVLVSVHAFATDPARGVFILAFFTIVVGSSLALYAWRAPSFSSSAEVRLLSREGLLLLNNVFLVVAAAAVFLGTLYPLVVDALNLGKLSVGPPYFNTVFVPLTLPLVLLVGFAAVMRWKNNHLRDLLKRVWYLAPLALGLGIAFPWLALNSGSVVVCLALTLAFWAMLTAVTDVLRWLWAGAGKTRKSRSVPLAIWGMNLAHFGLGVFVLGVTLASAYSVERDVRLMPGESASIGEHVFRFEGVHEEAAANYDAQVGIITIAKSGEEIATVRSEKRRYRAQGSVMTDAGVNARLHRDLYIAMGEQLEGEAWSLRLYFKPFIRCIWLGGFLMVLGGLLAVSDRRYRLQLKQRRVEVADVEIVAVRG
jgi:cytochrome c-type biogenesis protein CcmF